MMCIMIAVQMGRALPNPTHHFSRSVKNDKVILPAFSAESKASC